MMWIAALVIVVAIVAGLAHRKRAEVVESAAKPQPMPFPVVPSEGDRYASANGSWVFTVSGWELE